MTRTVLDLFAGLGGFSAAFAASDEWEVVTVDIEERFEPDIRADVMELRPGDLPHADVVLASPPCTTFSCAAGWSGHFTAGDATPETDAAREAVALTYHALGLIKALAPEFWFVENPVGNLRKVIGEPTGTVTYCQYGKQYQKPTDLWGEHPPMTYRRCRSGAPCHERNRETDGHGATDHMPADVAERAKVPYELSESILGAVEEAYANPPPEQTVLPGGTV
jgi:hypothetical protein